MLENRCKYQASVHLYALIILITASLTLGFLNIVAINLPEPSGSSPALKPPGNAIICDEFIPFTNLLLNPQYHFDSYY